jgi:putative nucleotidyltransferase with HDIG domain
MMRLRELVDSADALQPPGPATVRLAQAVADPASTAASIAPIIEFDPVLTALVLRMANAAAAASRRTVVTVREAVIRLGGGRILEFALARHIRKSAAVPLGHYGYSENELWRHSVASACAAELLASLVQTPLAGAAFTAALLHDIGKVLLVQRATASELAAVWSKLDVSDCTPEAAECEVLGFSHAEIGGSLAARWGLPAVIVDAIADHHASESVDSVVTAIVQAANVTARTIGEGVGYEGMRIGVGKGLMTQLDLTHEKYERLCSQTVDKFGEVMTWYGAD